jgi:glycosyltransferase involved in cell wall biosynthesis
MPTADRRRFVPTAIRYFLRQDYPSRELVILDDGSDSVADLVPDDARIRYIRLDRHLVLGEKRNRACELARGEVMVHWDDDDWQASHRVRYQVEELERSRADLCGSNRVLYLCEDGKRAWLYEFPETRRRWLAGNGLCYRKSLWERSPFPSIARGEDTQFVWSREAKNLAVHADHRYFVGLVHATNTSAKATHSSYWRAHPVEDVRTLLGDDFSSHLAR